MTARRRRYTVRGAHMARGVLLDGRVLGEPELRRRVLRAFEPQTAVYRCADDELSLALVWPSDRRLDARAAPGALLIWTSAGLTGVLPRPRTAGVGLAIAAAGVIETYPLDSETRVDVSSWLDLSGWSLVEPERLQGEGAVEVDVPTAVREVRDILGVQAPVPDLEILRRADEPAAGGGRSRWWAWLMGRQAPPSAGLAPSPPSGWRRLLATLLAGSYLGALVGRAQARYLERLVQMFEEGRLDDALRHAVGLTTHDAGPPRWSLGLPRAREALTISPWSPVGAASLLVGGPSVHEVLERLYRQAHERLLSAGRIEDAAFVLAELLDSAEEAVSLLERHGRLTRAAEIAEARRLHPGLVVRQWFVAGDRARGIAIARRTGAFVDAVVRLESGGHHDEARHLRCTFAELAAQAGDYVAAVEIIWPVETERDRATAWLEAAADARTPLGPALLVRAVLLMPEQMQRWWDTAVALTSAEGQDSVLRREELRSALQAVMDDQQLLPGSLRPFGAATARALLGDRACGSSTLDRRAIRSLARASGDAVLAADLPVLPPLATHTLQNVQLSDAEPGVRTALDVVLLAHGDMLVAFGEAGVELRGPDDGLVHRFETPAAHLVVSFNGARALALAPRAGRWRVTALALNHRTSRDLGDMAIDRWANRFDGAQWHIALDERLLVIDTLAERPRVIWQIPELGGAVEGLVHTATALFLLVRGASAHELWRFDAADLTLRQRQEVHFAAADDGDWVKVATSLTASGQVVQSRTSSRDARQWLIVRWNDAGPPSVDQIRNADDLSVYIDESIAVVTVRHEAGGAAQIGQAGDELRCESAVISRDGGLRVRSAFGWIAIWDDFGRIVVVRPDRNRIDRIVRLL